MALLDEVRAVCGGSPRQQPFPTDRARARIAVGRRAELPDDPPTLPAGGRGGRWRVPT